jgi:hypothetical protein
MPMYVDFTVIIRVQHRFGQDDSPPLRGEEQALFVGAAKEWEFFTNFADSRVDAILLFQSYGVSHRRNVLTINSQQVAGGIPLSIDLSYMTGGEGSHSHSYYTGGGGYHFHSQSIEERPVWNSNVLLVSNLINGGRNVLRIEARDQDGGKGGQLDNFIIDNVVILYKTDENLP